MAGLLEGKKILVTGVLDRRSIAYSVARLAGEQGADIALSGFGRAASLTKRTAKKLDPEPPVLELDANKPEDIEAVASDLGERWGGLDGIVHAIAFAPDDALGGNFLTAEWPSVATALQTSAYSLKALAVGLTDLMKPGSSIVGLDFDARIAWPAYDWMGVAKGRPGVNFPLPGPRSRGQGHPGKPRLGRPDKDPGRQRHQRLRKHRRRVAKPGPVGVGGHGPRARRALRGQFALRLVAGDDGGADPRGRRLPRYGSLDQVDRGSG